MADAVAGKDVAEPGTTPAAATSKPVIVGHTSQVADPMMNTPSVGSSRPKLTPSIEATAEHEIAEKVSAETVVTEDSEEKVEADSLARTQELIESGEYKVSIAQKARSGGARTFMLTLIVVVVVGAVALYLLVDSKMVDLGIKLPFHIFKQ